MTRSGWTSANSGPDYRAGGSVTITEFLNARLDEDEAAAKAANGLSWLETDGDEPGDSWIINEHMHLFETDTATAVHIALHDPERVLREVAAKRAVLAEHDPDGHYCVTQAGAQWTEPGQPCSTLRALLSVYSGHADYDEAWRPE